MPARPPLPALTGLRFVAAALVLVYHTFPTGRGVAPRWLEAFMETGFVGVSLFFVLSGFILTYNYEDAARAGTLAWPAFWRARFARIYPVYLLGLLVALPVFFLGSTRPPGQVLERIGPNLAASVALVQAWWPRQACVVNCPGWSISVEAVFYLLFPLASLALLGAGRRRLYGVAAAAWLLALVPPLVFLATAPEGAPAATHRVVSSTLHLLKFFPPFRVAEFVLGMAAGSLFLRRDPAPAARPWLEPAAAAAILVVLAGSAAIPYPVLHNGLLAPLFALLIYRLAAGQGALSRHLDGSRWATLGGASYALYILHVPVGSWVALGFRAAGVTPPPLLPFAVTAGVSIAAALLVFRFVEEPARVRLRGPAPRPRREPATVLEPVLAGD